MMLCTMLTINNKGSKNYKVQNLLKIKNKTMKKITMMSFNSFKNHNRKWLSSKNLKNLTFRKTQTKTL